MKKNIRQNKEGLQIKITEIDSHHEDLLDNFQLCQQGKCDCPSDEYSKLDSLNIESSKDEIVLNLKSRPGQLFDSGKIKKCIDHVVKKVSDQDQ